MPQVSLEHFNKIKRVYFVGIKGVGVAGLAIIAKEAGFVVGGSDISEEFITDSVLKRHDIKIDEGFNPAHFDSFVDGKLEEALVITTAAHDGLQNAQCKRAKELGILILTHGQAVGFFMEGKIFSKSFKGISVLGCHGKTTITAMLASSLTAAGVDPTYTVGTSQIFPTGEAGHLGKDDYFIAEADEFISDIKEDRTVKFLYQYPEYAIINNIGFDHPDVYKDLQEVKETFFKFVFENVKKDGKVFVNGDDKILQELRGKNINLVTYGEDSGNDLIIVNFEEKKWGSIFEVVSKGKSLGTFNINVPGYHNAKNSLAVIAIMTEIGLDLGLIKTSIAYFQGTKRRQEKLGETKNKALVIDDYAHHPEEIVKTIEAIRKSFPERKIICLFQPHTLERTFALRKEFAESFTGVKKVIFLPIFTSKREGETNYDQLYDSIKKNIQNAGVDVYFPVDSRTSKEKFSSPYFYEKNRLPVVKYIKENFDSPEFVILTLGAGDLYRIGSDLCENT